MQCLLLLTTACWSACMKNEIEDRERNISAAAAVSTLSEAATHVVEAATVRFHCIVLYDPVGGEWS